jgi:signal transduction histidine kinase
MTVPAQAVAVTGGVAGAGAGLLLATSDHLIHPVAYGLEAGVVVAGTVWVALYWALRRPGSHVSVVLLAYGAALAGVSLQGASSPVLHSIGVLFDAPTFLLGYYLIFIFPEGRLMGALEKALLAAVAWILLASFLPWFFFSPYVSGGAPLAGCNASCPSNALMISNNPDIAAGFGTTEDYLAVVLAAAIIVGLAYRLATASRPRRRGLLPVYVSATLLAVPFAVFRAAGAGAIQLSATSVDRIGWFVTTGRLLLTFGFLLAIWQAMLFAGGALKKIVGGLRREDDIVHLRELVAEALDDPELELAFEVDRGSRFFVSSRGDAVDTASGGERQSVTAVRRDGDTVALIFHDPALDTDPELLQAAGRAILLSLESGRLASELQSKIDELRISRARVVAAGDSERRRTERDLHDGLQQRVLALMMKVGFARSTDPDDPTSGNHLDEIDTGLQELLTEVRQFARGVYPAALADYGLTRALADVAERSTPPARFRADAVRRLTPEVEAAIYFCCLEALQNAAKHAGPGRASVRLWEEDRHVCFEVSDRGHGCDLSALEDEGVGLSNMRARISAVEGTLSIDSRPGSGTRVSGRIPTSPRNGPSADSRAGSAAETSRAER